jgi:hypothetical protein
LKNKQHLLFVVIIFCIILLLTFSPITDPDFWWHLKTGQWIAETHSIPRNDPFSYSAPNAPWIAHEWLSDLFIYSVYTLGGSGLLIAIFSLFILGAYIFTYLRCLPKSRPYIAGILILLGAGASIPFWGVRPQMISLLFSSLLLLLLDLYQERRQLAYLLFIPTILLLWVNMHGGFLLGLGILGIYELGNFIDLAWSRLKSKTPIEKTQKWLLFSLGGALLVSLLVCLINPYGYHILAYPFQTLTSNSMQQLIVEWFSPDFHQIAMLPFAIILLLFILFGMLGVKRISTTRIILVLVFSFGALVSVRHIPLFAIVAIPILAEQVSSLFTLPQLVQKEGPLVRWKVPEVLSAIMVLLIAFSFVKVTSRQQEVESVLFPKAAADWIQQKKIEGNLFSSYTWSGYLIWRLAPGDPVYIDGRMDVYNETIVNNYEHIYYTQPGWQQTLDNSSTNLILVETDSKLANALKASTNWKLIYADSQCKLFSKDENEK